MISILFITAVEMINYFVVLIILVTCALYFLGKQLDVQPTKVKCTSANDQKSSEGHNSETDGDDMEADGRVEEERRRRRMVLCVKTRLKPKKRKQMMMMANLIGESIIKFTIILAYCHTCSINFHARKKSHLK